MDSYIKIKSLISNVKILKENSDYRCADIILHRGERWKHSKDKVINDPKYKDTIMNFFLKYNNNNDRDLKFLLFCINKYSSKNKLLIPDDDEIVIHLRMGDVVVNNWFLKKDYVSLIKKIIKKNTINKITIVTSFAYQVWSEDSLHLRKTSDLWNYSDNKQKQNEEALFILLSILQEQINLPINIYSNENVDVDLCYCVFSKHFIKDQGGFSDLMYELNKIKKQTI